MSIDFSRRLFLAGAAAAGIAPAAAKKLEAHRFMVADFEIAMQIEYHDGYASRGFWFRQGNGGRPYCLSADGEEGRKCLTEFRGSLAVAHYQVRGRGRNRNAPAMREYVRTVDRDPRLGDRPPFEKTIELKRGAGSDLQAFGYEAGTQEVERMLRSHGPWYLFRQDLFLEPERKPFLVIFWKHALASIRVLDIIPGEETWAADK